MALAMKRFDMMVARLTLRTAGRFLRNRILAGRSARPALKDTQTFYCRI